jgi:hypothetical protein
MNTTTETATQINYVCTNETSLFERLAAHRNTNVTKLITDIGMEDAYRLAASMPKSLELLGFNEDTQPGICVVVNADGNMNTLLGYEKGYEGYQGYLDEGLHGPAFVSKIEDSNSAKRHLSSSMKSWGKTKPETPKAIVNSQYEAQFIETAQAIGIKPVKLTDELL